MDPLDHQACWNTPYILNDPHRPFSANQESLTVCALDLLLDSSVRTSKDSLQFLLTNPERTRLHCTIGYWKLVSATNFSGPAFHAEQCCRCGSAKSQQKDVKSSKIVKIRAWLKEFTSCLSCFRCSQEFGSCGPCFQVWCDKEYLQISLGIRTNLG